MATDINISATLPGEAAVVKALEVVEKLIDGQSPEQKVLLWQQWIDFWKPLIEVLIKKNG